MRKIILSICFVLLASEVFSTSETGPYISVSELSLTENSGHTVPEILSRLTDFASFTEMTYWSEWRKKERILFDRTVCNRHPCIYREAHSFRAQGRMGNHEECPFCDWNSRAADRAVCRRFGVSCDPSFAPCAVDGISLARFERNVRR